MFSRLSLIVAAAALSGCVSTQPVGTDPGITVVDSMPAPTRADLVAATRPYLVGPFDTLRIDVFGVEELQRETQVDASGQLAFPLIGGLQVAGSTPNEIATEIEDRLRGRFVRNPQVTVNLVETVSQVLTVDGEVTKPGLYPVMGRMTLMRAVALAGGASEDANLQDVIIFREVEGQQLAGLYNLQAIRRGNYGDPEVYPSDVIIVGDSPQRELFETILQAAPLLTTPLILLLRR